MGWARLCQWPLMTPVHVLRMCNGVCHVRSSSNLSLPRAMQGLPLELRTLLDARWTAGAALPFLGFGASMFCFYSLVSAPAQRLAVLLSQWHAHAVFP